MEIIFLIPGGISLALIDQLCIRFPRMKPKKVRQEFLLKVRNGKIILAGTGEEEEFPLTVDDIFLLDLSPLTIPNEVTVEEVALELEATPSAQTETEITPTPFLTPESETPTSE